MSDWKASNSDIKKLHTDSNLKTNTSFQFGQASHDNFGMSPHPILLHEEQTHSNLYMIEQEHQINNNSSFSLQPTITRPMALEFITLVQMVKFYSRQNQQKLKLIKKKQDYVNRISELVCEQQQRMKNDGEVFRRKKQALEKKRGKVVEFKKKKIRAVTEETQQMEVDIKCMLKGIRIRNTNRSFIQNRRHVEQNSYRDEKPKKQRIYVPISPYYYPTMQNQPQYTINMHPNPHNVINSHTQVPTFINGKPVPSAISSQQYNSNLAYQQHQTKPKQPIIMEQLREALTLKLKLDLNDEQSNDDLGYFDIPLDSRSRSRHQQPQGKSETPNSMIRRSSSIKWRKDDKEDKELVEIIEKSMKHIKIQNNEEETHKMPLPNQIITINQHDLQRMSPIRHVNRVNNSNNSSINITYDSQEKRNSKSFQSKQDPNEKKKLSSKNSEKKSKIDQSNIKIELIDMSISKNSVSSKSDSSKHVHSKYTPSLNQQFQKIQEQSQQIASLKATPIESKLKNSMDQQNSKNMKKQQPSPKNNVIRTPPNLYKEQDDEDDILKSIKLDTQSRISRKNHFMPTSNTQEEGQDILDGIMLLKQSRASREKALSLKSSIHTHQMIYEQDSSKEKGSQSQIFTKTQDADLPVDFFDSSLRYSTKSKIVKNRKSAEQASAINKRGQTEPIKGQLTSIPSAQFQEQEDQTPPQSRNRPKNSMR